MKAQALFVCMFKGMDVNPASIQHLLIERWYLWKKYRVIFSLANLFSMANTNFKCEFRRSYVSGSGE